VYSNGIEFDKIIGLDNNFLLKTKERYIKKCRFSDSFGKTMEGFFCSE